ncbi:outer membrane beta-barrel family protein [Psychroflexus planctonicus]|uniref:Outer membrane protein beta-barrel domain-containing protein n=1 Tax=Psychroflexus planctonicus TaxID=1526575 RepID=A0ABQ1SMZ8_9FLAO|nr:outer membrane beta-barrel family protein [Psychroflexus planctonicus]GGE44823.1 hypothetical protein GCM10010832_25990 [Psychroflexus planctonicus]
MQKTFFILSCFFIILQTAAQDFEVKGKIIDNLTNQPLYSATIFAESLKDSTLVAYTISDQDGNFLLEGRSSAEKLNLFITYTGLQAVKKVINPAEKIIDIGEIKMEESSDELDEVLIKTTRSPIVLKKDTLEFNAKSFKTRENATLEDTLKQLPGVEVAADGSITVNGQTVNRILVNGKEFFGNDPKVATKNLPKEIIDKIQVVDTKTREEEFTGKASDSEDKTINITIDEDKNKGYFSRATAGYGTDDRYDTSAIFNYFKDKMRFSILASANNINSPGFSYDEVFDAIGSTSSLPGGFFGNNNGITTSETIGGNYVNEWDDGKYDLATDYFYGATDRETRTSTIRENILPDRSFFTQSENSGNNANESHRFSGRFDIKPDTLTRISINPNININLGTNDSESTSSSFDEDNNIINSAETFSFSESTSANFRNDLIMTRKLDTLGSYLSLSFNNSHNRNDNENLFNSERIINAGNETQIQNQLIDQENNTDNYRGSFTYRQSLAKQLFLDVGYSYEANTTSNTRNIFDFDENTGSYSNFNETLSNEFKARSQINRPNLGLRYETEKVRSGASLGLLNTTLRTENFSQNIDFSNTFNDMYANAFIRYQFSRSKSIQFNYSNSVDIPNVQQLQPVEIITDPLNIRVGNPDLNPSLEQSFRLNFRNFDFKTRSGYGIFSRYSITDNQVVPVLTTDENLVRTTSYTNVNGVQNAFAYLYFSKTIPTEGTDVIRYNLYVSNSYNRNVGFSNGQKFNSDLYAISPGLRFTYEIPDLFTLQPNVRFNYNNTAYNIFSDRNEDFTNTELGLEATLFWPENIIFGSDFTYFNYGNVSDAFESTSLFWNLSLGYQFLDEKATLKIKVYDVLDQNISTRRSTGDDFIQDTDQLILQRYAMLSFTYKLDKFGGKKPPSRGGRRYRR